LYVLSEVNSLHGEEYCSLMTVLLLAPRIRCARYTTRYDDAYTTENTARP